ncbi:peptidase M20 domain-containing protein 2-like [Mizuhopecten yessoensis]|uniref:Peptidase M20 domain-containing protein 2 n=1 Tax=Mizuhopecten yessoensis TaxID=6573 RepID=A0A210PM42_MIZYE|nr:peptidase M20 domain-containing protein 2-like [Mizuhopecten yessoensis]OWF37534.1 Peptidase M20 domain-containing protein 2 [Mizuhopecten yessoensis]
MADLKKLACDHIDKLTAELGSLSQDIWDHPELGYKEYHAHDVISNFLEERGFEVRRKYKLDTSFCATFGHNVPDNDDLPHIAVLCEYDALPGIGHACGHNLIAEVGVATGVAIKHALESAGKPMGKLTVLGTPAEEGLCGKHDLIKGGAFDGVDAAMMAHPSQFTVSKPNYVSMTPVTITYRGQAAHASSYPWEGVNALDAAVLCYNNISCLRQQMKPTWRVHGVISKGGLQPNIIPEETELQYYLRTPTEPEHKILISKVTNCIEAAALATGCETDYKYSEKHYYSLLSNATMADVFEENAKSVGIAFEQKPELIRKFGGSTDMGNVSHIVPSIHPKFYIGTTASNHSKTFTQAAGDPKAQPYTLAIAKGLAMTALDLFTKPDLLSTIRADYQRDVSEQA